MIQVLKKLGLAALLALLASCAPQQTKPSYISIKSASVNVREVAVITHVHLQELPDGAPDRFLEGPFEEIFSLTRD